MRALPVVLVCAGCLSAPTPAVFDGGPDGDGGIPDAANGDAEVPVTLGPIDFVTGIAAGEAHSCARFDNGALRCWGRNAEGQLGRAAGGPLGDDEPPSAGGDLPLGIVVSQIAAGKEHTCALSDDGRVRCFGKGTLGRLGHGNTDDLPAGDLPSVALGAGATAIAAGDFHTCAILTGGAVRCWGSNASGQLGLPGVDVVGDDETPASLAAVDLGGPAERIAAGDAHTCAILTGGAVRCWGSNAGGRLGLPGVDMVGDDETPGSTGPVALGAGAERIAAGSAHSCAVLTGGALRCWGAGGSGRLGTGATDDVGDDEVPGDAAAALAAGALDVAAGGDFTCAVVTGGDVRCWGEGANGALGAGTTADATTPGAAVALGAGATELAAGHDHVCALLATRSVRCWGDNTDGQIGKPGLAALGDGELPDTVGGVQVLRVVEVACGARHTCARIENGRVRCWGEGDRGKLGNLGTLPIGDDELPGVAGDVDLGARAVALALGQTHSCAMIEGGAVRCWGEGLVGELGYGNDDDIGDSEAPATAGDVDFGGTATALAAGKGRTCVVLAGTGDVRCWGSNEYGAMGNQATGLIGETEEAFAAPLTAVGGPVTDLVADIDHTCARLQDGTARCWGRLLHGRLGVPEPLTEDIGDDEDPSSIDTVRLGDDVLEVAVGLEHSCARLTGGAVRCWGHGLLGRLGTSAEDDIGDGEDPSTLPVVMVGGVVTQLAAGGSFTCALLDDGAVRCWGYAADGELPYGTGQTIGDDEHPTAAGDAPLGGVAIQIAAGDGHGCAVLDTGALRCWGLGGSGQTGYGTTENLGDGETPAEYGDVQLF